MLPGRTSDAGPMSSGLEDANDAIWSADEHLHDAADDCNVDTMYRNLLAAQECIRKALLIVERKRVEIERKGR